MSRVCLYLLLLLLFLQSCTNTAGSGTEEGNVTATITVTTAEGTLAQNRTVYLCASQYPLESATFIDSATTDAEGSCQFDSIPIGEYKLSVSVENHSGFMGEPIQIDTSISDTLILQETGFVKIKKYSKEKQYDILGTGFSFSGDASDSVVLCELPFGIISNIVEDGNLILDSALEIDTSDTLTVLDKPYVAFLYEGTWDNRSTAQGLFSSMEEVARIKRVHVDSVDAVGLTKIKSIYISSSVTPTGYEKHLSWDLDKPLVIGNSALYSYFSLVDTTLENYQGVSDSQSNMLVRISHPVFSLFPNVVNVNSSITHESLGFSHYGKPYDTVDRIAVSTKYNSQALLFAFEKGVMAGSYKVPALRIGVFAGDLTPTADGYLIMQGAILWSAGEL